MCYPSRILHVGNTAAAGRMQACQLTILAPPNAHGDANDLVAFLEQNIGRETAVDPSAHSDNDSLPISDHGEG